MTDNNEHLTFGQKIGYGVGDIFGGGALVVVGIYYLYFLTDIIKLDPALAGIILLVSKIWDAVSDPLMGIISDRTRTRYGRRRPYFLAGIILIFLSTVLLWYPVNFELEMHRFIFVLFAYIFFSTVITMVMVPYNALSSELTLDYSERTSLVSVRMWFSGVSGLLCAALPIELVKQFPDARDGYTAMAVTLGLFFALPFIATFLFTKERPEFMTEKKKIDPMETIRKTFIEPFRIRTFRNVLFLYVFSFLTMDIVMAIVIYFVTYYLVQGDQTNYILGTLFIVQLAFIPVLYFLSQKLNKKTAFMFCIFYWMILMVMSLFMQPEYPIFLAYIFGGLVGIASGGVGVLAYSIFPDVPDVDELYSGERREGIYAGLYTFVRKVCSALALFIVSISISMAGYRAPVSEKVDGVLKTINQTQTAEFLLTLKIIFAVFPILFLFFSLINAIRYPLTPDLHARLQQFLDHKRNNTGDPEKIEAEERVLKEILI